MTSAQASSSSHQPLPPQPLKPFSKTSAPKTVASLQQFCTENVDSQTAHPDIVRQWLLPALNHSFDAWPGATDKGVDVEKLKKEKDKELEVLLSPWVTGGVGQHGLAVLYLFCRRLALPAKPETHPIALFNSALAFVRSIRASHLRMSPLKAEEFSKSILQFGLVANYLPQAIQIVRELIMAWQYDLLGYDGGGSFTPFHKDYVEYCLFYKQFSGVEDVIGVPIIHVDFPSLNYREFLAYHYLGGLIFTHLNKWDQAIDMFETAVTAPGNAASAIQVAAHKKLVLIHLLQTGEAYTYPKYINGSVTKAIKTHCQLYTELATNFLKIDDKRLDDLWQKWGNDITLDGNRTLFHMVYMSHAERRLLQLTKTFSKISLDDLAVKLSTKSRPLNEDTVGEMIYDMISRKVLDAQISPPTDTSIAYVTFLSDPATFNDKAVLQQLQSLTDKIQVSGKVFDYHDRQMALDEKWLKASVRGESTTTTTAIIKESSGGFNMSGTGVKGVGSNWADTGF